MSFAVVIPTYNRAGFIGETLASIRAQTLPPAEIIVIDDGSTDDTATVVQGFPGVVYHRSANRGAPHARHLGVRLSTALRIAFCDSDDLWLPEHLAGLDAVFAADPAIGFAFSNFREMADAAGERRISTLSKFDQAPPDFWKVQTSELFAGALRCDAPLVTALLRFQPIFPSAMAISRAQYERIGGFKPDLGMLPSEDWEFSLRAVAQAPIGIATTPSVLIRKHAGNHSRRVGEMLLGEAIVLDIALHTHNPTPDVAQAMEQEIGRRLLAALDALFASKCLAPLPAMARALGWGNLPPKTRLKAVLARLLPAQATLPDDLRQRLDNTLAKLRARRLTSQAGLVNYAPQSKE